jgi:hypothetical protein
MSRNPWIVSLLVLSLCACGGEQEAPPAGEAAAPSPAAGAAEAPSAPAASPVGPLSSSGQAVGSGAGAAAQGAGLGFDLPAGWQSETPANNMRLAQASIPGEGGAGNLAVFFFGPGGGGGVEDNLQRWISQMEVAPGIQPERGTLEANGFRITWVDVKGTLLPSSMGMGPSTPQPGSRLLGAVVEGEGGPWFFKATGPEATMAAQRDAFFTMLRSVRGA